jgi:hypothetical protein
LFWLGKYYFVRFETDVANLKNLENYLNNHPKRASTASPFSGGSELKQAKDIVVQSVNNTQRRSMLPVGYLTYEDRQKLKWALAYPPSVYFITLGGSLAGDSGIKTWPGYMCIASKLE